MDFDLLRTIKKDYEFSLICQNYSLNVYDNILKFHKSIVTWADSEVALVYFV